MGVIVSSEGIDLAFDQVGDGADIVLIHAGICDRRMWNDLVPLLAANFRVTRLDLRGYGESPMPPRPFAHHADVVRLLNRLGIGATMLVGASYGGTVAVETTLEHPALVSGLVLLNTLVARERPSPALADGWEASDDLAVAGDLDAAVDVELRLWVDGPGQSVDRVPSAIREQVRQMNRALFDRLDEHEAADELELVPSAVHRLQEIDVPTLVVLGDLDVPDARDTADRLLADIRTSRLLTIPDAAHLPSMEHPARIATAILETFH